MISQQAVSKKEFFTNHTVQWLFAFSLLLHFVLWGMCIGFFQGDGGLVTLRFNIYLGSDPASIGPWYTPYQIPLGAGIFLVAHLIGAWFFFKRRDRIMAHLIVFSGIIIQIAALIALVSIILKNR